MTFAGLVKDPNAIINDNFDLIMEDLLQSVVSGKNGELVKPAVLQYLNLCKAETWNVREIPR